MDMDLFATQLRTNDLAFGRRVVIGTPVTPKRLLEPLAGSSFCVSFAAPDQVDDCIRLVGRDEILLLDNGAFSIWRAEEEGRTLPKRLRFESRDQYRQAFWDWANPILEECPQAVAVIPDVIGGSERENLEEVSLAVRYDMCWYPERSMAIWHLDQSLELLTRLSRLMNFIGLGSCGEYDVQKHREAYVRRCDEAGAVIDEVQAAHGRRPWVHLMRGLGLLDQLCQFDSADSTDAAVNHHRHKCQGDLRAEYLANRRDQKIKDATARADLVDSSPVSNWEGGGPTLRPRPNR